MSFGREWGGGCIRGFTLIELLTVVATIALLIGILLPSLGMAREQGRAAACLANMHGIGQGLVLYQNDNSDFLIPSYNMTGYGQTGTSQTVDGWPAILDLNQYVTGYNSPTNNAFYCPDTLPIETNGETGTDPNNPKGYQDWPTTFLDGGDSNGQADPTLPATLSSGVYNDEIRCGYWLNAKNPIGTQETTVVNPCPYYTWSVGYTAADGSTMNNVSASNICIPGALIVAADGVAMGSQSDDQVGMTNSRIGYRHPGGTGGSANTAFADGHAQPMTSAQFPLASGGSNVYAQVQAENFGLYTVYANPHASLP